MKHSKLYKLSDTEQVIMEIFWEAEDALTFKEIMTLANEKLNKNWKKQTVNTYLANLQKAGLLHADKRCARAYFYSPAYTKEEYTQLCVRGLVQESFDNSIFNFVSAFTGGKKLSKEDADELRKLI